jgi:predicted phage terminase large subunit-like protein
MVQKPTKKILSQTELNFIRVQKNESEKRFLFFVMMMFYEHYGFKFTPHKHLQKIAAVLEAVAAGILKRVIINIPPRYGKTEIAVKMFIAWGLAMNPKAKFLHLSYSETLALDNSATAKEYIQSEHFQKIWPMALKFDKQSKSNWFNTQQGGCYATSSGGAITGFGAGIRTNRAEMKVDNPFKAFGGAILVDDANKPDDAYSDVKREFINNRYNNTIKSRVNNRETPIIVIQQRLHEADLSGFLLSGGSGEKWYHLNLPALDKNNTPLCEDIHNFKELEQMRQADRYTFAGQYMQQPSPEEGGILMKSWFKKIKRSELPHISSWQLFIDGAYTKNTRNDPTGLFLSAKSGKNLYVLSFVSKYLEMPELLKYIPEFINSVGVIVDSILIEPKASGLSMAQLLRNQTNFNIIELKGKILRESKIERASKSSPYCESGRVILVEGIWNDGFLHQLATFPNAKHDEAVDLLAYAIDRDLFDRSRQKIYW